MLRSLASNSATFKLLNVQRYLLSRQVTPLQPIARRGSLQTRSLLTAQRNVVFPPDPSRPLFIYAVFIFGSAAWELWSFYSPTDAVEDIARKAKSGEQIFGPAQTAKAMLMLDAYASNEDFPLSYTDGDVVRLEVGNEDFPNLIPRVIRFGGLDAIRNGLYSKDTRVITATAKLASTISARPGGSKILVKDEALRHSIVRAFNEAIDAKVCRDCGGSSAEQLMLLLSTVAHILPYYPFGIDPEEDLKLKEGLTKLAQRTVAYAELHDGRLLPDYMFPWNSERGHPWLPPGQEMRHDPGWYSVAIEMLLDIAVKATFLKRKDNQEFEIVVKPIVDSLNRLYTIDVFDEEQTILFGLVLMDVWTRHPDFVAKDITILQSVDELQKSFFLRHGLTRKFVKEFLSHLDFLSTVIFAGAFGYVWGGGKDFVCIARCKPTSSHLATIASLKCTVTRSTFTIFFEHAVERTGSPSLALDDVTKIWSKSLDGRSRNHTLGSTGF